MKRIFSCLLVFALIVSGIFAFAGCNKNVKGKWGVDALAVTVAGAEITMTKEAAEAAVAADPEDMNAAMTLAMFSTEIQFKGKSEVIFKMDGEEAKGTYTVKGNDVTITITDPEGSGATISYTGTVQKDGRILEAMEEEGMTIKMYLKKK